MRITTQGDYALRCLLHIARHGHAGPVAISRMVEEEGLPQDYIEQLLMKLRRRGLIKSTRGVKGGYLLNKAAGSISVKDVLDAVEGHAFEIICRRSHARKRHGCRDGCVLSGVWQDLKKAIEKHLELVTIEGLLGRMEKGS